MILGGEFDRDMLDANANKVVHWLPGNIEAVAGDLNESHVDIEGWETDGCVNLSQLLGKAVLLLRREKVWRQIESQQGHFVNVNFRQRKIDNKIANLKEKVTCDVNCSSGC